MQMKKMPEVRFDLTLAKGIVDSYYSLSGCLLYTSRCV